jgi:host factor-I protein
MASSNVNLQDSFLNQVRKDNTVVELTLSNGEKYQGAVKGFDNFTLILHVDEKQHLIYKHAVAQIVAPKFSRNEGSNKKRSPKPDKKKGGGQKKEKFNALDLSNIKLDKSDDSEE